MPKTKSGKIEPKTVIEKKLSEEEILIVYRQLVNERRNLVNKLTEVETDLNEHKLVLETLKDLEEDRKCFRLIGGVLCEKTVKDVIPTLTSNRDQLMALSENLNEQVTKKSTEINEYKDTHNIGWSNSIE